jgi:hypothetical protein
MATRLGPIDLCCDSPPYSIVQACAQVGIQCPEDVRWTRISVHQSAQAGWKQFVQHAPWNVFLAGEQNEEGPCNCGQIIPKMELYVFTLDTGKQLSYYLAQCPRCYTVFWELT